MRYVIREKFFHLGEDSQITDEQGRVVFQVDGKVLTLHNTLVMRDIAGNEAATVRRQLISLRPSYTITRQGQELAEVRKKLISPFIDRYPQMQRSLAFHFLKRNGYASQAVRGGTVSRRRRLNPFGRQYCQLRFQ